MKHTIPLVLGLFACFLLNLGCSASASAPDPTSWEALHKAPTLKWGSTCVERGSYSYGDLGGSTSTPYCEEDLDCADAEPITTGLGTTYYSNFTYFEGTCADQHPVTCDQRVPKDDCDACQYEQCCTFVALCEDDPNCLAVNDCFIHCKDDDKCARNCALNGDLSAEEIFRKANTCINNRCSDRC